MAIKTTADIAADICRDPNFLMRPWLPPWSEVIVPQTPVDGIERGPAPPSCSRATSRRVRRLTLAAARRQADKAGLTIRGAAVYADHVELTFGQPAASEPSNDLDKWLLKHPEFANAHSSEKS